MENKENKKFVFECRITEYTETIKEIVAESSSKARYKFYQSLDADELYSEYFKYIKVRKIGICSEGYLPRISEEELEKFNNVIERRGIEFAKIGMKISVGGKFGVVIGANSSMNLDVDFSGDGVKSNCHPTWETIYYDRNNDIIKNFCKAVLAN